MKTRLIILLCAAAAAGGAVLLSARPPVSSPEFRRERIALAPEFFDARIFDAANAKTADVAPVAGRVRAAVLPHHLLAAPFIAGTLRAVSNVAPSTVVIVGPNHENAGRAALITAKATWETPAGEVQTDDAMVDALVAATGAGADPDAFRREHSVGALVPFVERAFPKARIVPVIAASYTGRREAEALARWLAALDQKTLVLFSIDFSHYLTPDVSDLRDAETLQTILRSDVQEMLLYQSDHLDAPAPMAAFIQWSSYARLRTCVWAHANANDFLETDQASVTGYYALALMDGDDCGSPLAHVVY